MLVRERLAWSKYYSMSEIAKDYEMSRYLAICRMIKLFLKDEVPSKAIQTLYRTFDVECRIYTKFTDKSMTHKGSYTPFGKTEECDYHMTPANEPYKPWKDGDAPCYYMETYNVSNSKYFDIHSSGFWCVKPDLISKMSPGHRRDILVTMTKFVKQISAFDGSKVKEITFTDGAYKIVYDE